MRSRTLGYGIVSFLGVGVVFACSGPAPSGFTSGHSPGDPSTPPKQDVPDLGGSLGPSDGEVDCYVPGAKLSCWTGPVGDRNRGLCHDGTQECVQGTGEVPQAKWTACTGQELNCGALSPTAPVADGGAPPTGAQDTGAAPAPDAGSPPAGAQVCENPSQGTCCDTTCTGCVPGAVIFCYDSCIGPPEYCMEDVQQTCQPDGTWGPCTETGATFVPGSDCIHFWDGCDLNGGAGSYAGNCDSAFQGCTTPFSAACPSEANGVIDFGAGSPLPSEDGGSGGSGLGGL
jgi:hypothetical protein